MRKLEKCERRRSERNPFLACSFAAAQEVRSVEANAYFLRKWVCRPAHKFVEGREVRDQADSFSIRLGDEERRAAPCCGLVDGNDDPFVNQLRDCLLGLRFIVFGDAPCRCDTCWRGIFL